MAGFIEQKGRDEENQEKLGIYLHLQRCACDDGYRNAEPNLHERQGNARSDLIQDGRNQHRRQKEQNQLEHFHIGSFRTVERTAISIVSTVLLASSNFESVKNTTRSVRRSDFQAISRLHLHPVQSALESDGPVQLDDLSGKREPTGAMSETFAPMPPVDQVFGGQQTLRLPKACQSLRQAAASHSRGALPDIPQTSGHVLPR